MPIYAVSIFFNETRGGRFEKFMPGNTLVRGNMRNGSQKSFLVTADTPEGAANQAHMFFNRDDRPNGASERSLSVGDVVRVKESTALDKPNGELVYLACERIGWVPIDQDEVSMGVTNKVSPHACCAKAEIIGCVCMYSFHCPDHSETHIGTHD